MPFSDYPDWVKIHKQKGVELRCINNKYYLYSVHCERVNGKNKKITDQYLGRITEDGIIPPSMKEISITVKEFGKVAFIFSVCEVIINSIVSRFSESHKTLIPLAICEFLYQNDIDSFQHSYLSILFPNLLLSKVNESNKQEVSRIVSMFHHQVDKTLKHDESSKVFTALSRLYIVNVKNKWVLSNIDNSTDKIIQKYHIKLEISYGKN